MKQDILDINGKVIGSIDLPDNAGNLKKNGFLLSQVITAYRARRRQGKASTKTRGEVQGSTRKLYRQKGTGRARAGSLRSPIRVGGGIAFGPRPRNFKQSIPKRIKRKALLVVLAEKAKKGKINIVSGLEKLGADTKEAIKALKLIYPKGLGKEKILLVAQGPVDALEKAMRNIPALTMIDASVLNTYTLINQPNLLFTKNAIEHLLEKEIKWKGKKSKNLREGNS